MSETGIDAPVHTLTLEQVSSLTSQNLLEAELIVFILVPAHQQAPDTKNIKAFITYRNQESEERRRNEVIAQTPPIMFSRYIKPKPHIGAH